MKNENKILKNYKKQNKYDILKLIKHVIQIYRINN